MARPFMFAALCQRAHPLKHSLAESIFVSQVPKTEKKIFVSQKICQQVHSLAEVLLYIYIYIYIYIYTRGAGKSLARTTSRCILFDGENISFDASPVLYIYIHIYVNSTNIPPIMIINRIYELQNLLSLQFVSFLVGLRTYQHPSTP